MPRIGNFRDDALSSELVNLAEAGDGESKPFAIASLNEKVAWVPRHWDKATVDSGVGNPKKQQRKKESVM